MNKTYVFQIGFNKCATRSLHHLFRKSGHKALHYHYGRLATAMDRRLKKGLAPVPARWANVTFFSDMETIKGDKPIVEFADSFKDLDRIYPNAIFVLNTRSQDRWIKSRLAHGGGAYLKAYMKKHGQTKEQVITAWRRKWDKRHREVKRHFKGRPRKLLVYDIEKDRPEKIARFFKGRIDIDPLHWKVLGKTRAK